ncbi:MAG: 50S ribosomal protein L11 methyltransferase [Bacteroidota bacterium]
MDYYGIKIIGLTDPVHREVAVALLSEKGCDSFDEAENSMTAYVTADLYKETITESVKTFFNEQSIHPEIVIDFYPSQNWNEVWEKNFDPVVISDDCIICAPFHENIPDCKYKIVIMPQMSFGTGHHETTSQMCSFLLQQNLHDKKVLDMGCGTAVLAVLAAKLGAEKVVAIDNDEQACENARENIERNGLSGIPVIAGGAEVLKDQEFFNLILANINRNVLTRDMNVYADHLQQGGILVVSGFFIQEEDLLKSVAAQNGMKFISAESKNNWACMSFCKE